MRSLSLLLMLGACTGAPPPEPTGEKKPAIPVRKELPKAKEDAGPKAMTEDTVRKAFEAEAVVKGTGGRVCGAWRDRVVITRPAERGGYDLRVRPRTDDLDADCVWDGPVLVEARVPGEVAGVFWPYIVVYQPLPDHSGRIQVLQGTTGGVVTEIMDATKPRYERQLVVSFEVPVIFEPEKGADQRCDDAISASWARMLPELERGGSLHADTSRDSPRCPPAVTERFCDRFAFLMPHELVLGESAAHPSVSEVGCAHVPAE